MPLFAYANDNKVQKANTDLCHQLENFADFSNNEYCEVYLRGYLAGASMIDEIYLSHLIDSHETTGFQNRAFRTRVGSIRSPKIEQKAPFCLPGQMTVEEVLNSFVSKMSQSSPADVTLNDTMYQFLVSEYPC